MTTNQNYESWIDEVRIKDYEANKGLTHAQMTRKTNSAGRKIAKQYGITVVKSARK